MSGRWILLAAACAVATMPARARAQYYDDFGQNKIQYRDFDWHVLKGPHVDLYFYPQEETIARVALAYAEESYTYLAKRFDHEVKERIPLIIYASHTDFEQTNVLPFVPEEGILGVTEYLKRRVTIPFRGSYSEFRHTVRHELVHVFQLSILTQQFELYPRGRRAATPLWWSEGLAEYFSSPQDTQDEMIIRDLTLHGRLPSIQQLDFVMSAIVYPIGGEIHHFLGLKYGDWRIPLLYQSLWKYDSFDDAMRAVYGKSVEQLSEEWQYWERERFFPAVAGRRPFEVAGHELADLAIKPVAVPRADSLTDIAYLSPRTGYTNIYLQPLDGPRKAHVEVEGERSPEFESFHAFFSRIDARNNVLVFGSKYGDRDALFFWDMGKHKVVGRYQFPDLVGIMSPAWSPDGTRVAFSGLTRGGISDIYMLEMKTGKLSRVTDDPYEDLDPTWLPGGRSIVFSSDRAKDGPEGAKNLYRVSVDDHEITPLTAGDWTDNTPRWDPEIGRVVFTSDRDGTFNLYSVDTLGHTRRETRLDGGVFDPAPVPHDRRIVVSGFDDLTWSLFSVIPDTSLRKDTTTVFADADSSGRWQWQELADASTTKVKAQRYHRDFSLDFAAGGSDVAPGYYGAQGGQLYFSDLLGDQSLIASFATYQYGGVKDLFTDFNGNLLYLNQAQRLNWGVGAFRVAGEFYERDFTQLYREKSAGVYGLLRYPLSRFTRIEGQTSLEYSHRDDFLNTLVEGPPERRGYLVSNFVSFVGDNALWLESGPIDGHRFNLSGGVISDMSHGVFENWIGLGDVRKYIRTSLQSAFALRAFGYVSEGTRPRATQIGGSWLLRGYPRFTIDGTRAWVANSEWRFPITNYVAFGFPFGAIRFPQVQGAFFADLGQAWYKHDYDPRVLGSAGVGFRMPLVPGLVLRLDLGRRFSLAGRPGSDLGGYYRSRFVDFFFGYDY